MIACREDKKMIKAHKIRLNPTPEQAAYFAKAAGTSRFVWNWALAEWDRQYQAGQKPTALKLKKQFNEIRREQFPWTWEDMQLSDRIFACQNVQCPYYLFPQDRDYNASLNILREALRLIGLLDQAADGIGSDDDVNLAADAG